jgi:hypothetical protein
MFKFYIEFENMLKNVNIEKKKIMEFNISLIDKDFTEFE